MQVCWLLLKFDTPWPCSGGRGSDGEHQPTICFAEARASHAVQCRFEGMNCLNVFRKRFPESSGSQHTLL